MFVYYWNFICIHNPSQTDNHRTILLFIYLLIYFGIKMCGECSIQTIYLRGGWGNNNYFLLKKKDEVGFLYSVSPGDARHGVSLAPVVVNPHYDGRRLLNRLPSHLCNHKWRSDHRHIPRLI